MTAKRKAKGRIHRGDRRSVKATARKKSRPFVPPPLPPIRRLSDAEIRKASELGRSRAAESLRARDRFLKSRPTPFAPGSRGMLLFEGDSWFDYLLGTDIPRELEDMEYERQSDAHAGDRIEDMFKFPDGLRRLIGKQTKVPKAFLLSGGGNDIVHNRSKEFFNMMNPPSNPGWNEDEMVRRIDKGLQTIYVNMLNLITGYCAAKWPGVTIPILIHGYGNPVPDGTPAGVKGPWLEPVFKARRYVDSSKEVDLAICTPLMEQLIGRLNCMLKLLPGMPGLGHVRYVDVRPALSNKADYQDYWANELHLTERGWKAVTRIIAAALPQP